MKEMIRINIIQKIKNKRLIFTFFLLSSMIYAIMLLITIPRVMEYSGGLKILDMMPTGYTHEYVQNLLSTLGEKGRNAYLFFQIPLDLIYPLLFGVSNCLLMAYILNQLRKLERNYIYFTILPLAAGICDYFENFGIIGMLTSYPNNSSLLSQFTNVFSILKSGLTSLFFLSFIYFLIRFAIQKLVQPKK